MIPYSYLVLGVNPTAYEGNVSVDSKIRITFAKPMNTDTLTSSTIRLRKINGDYIEYEGHYTHQSQIFTMTPSAKLEYGTEYQIVISGGKEGVLSVDYGYLPTAAIYEFSTAKGEDISDISTLTLSQEYLFVKAKWDLPTGLGPSEDIHFNVKLSSSSNPLAADLWPNDPIEGKTTSTTFIIPYKVAENERYYVHVQGVLPEQKTNWITSQIFIEPIITPGQDDDTQKPPIIPNPDEPGENISGQIQVIDHGPSMQELINPKEVVVLFDDIIDPLSIQNPIETNSPDLTLPEIPLVPIIPITIKDDVLYIVEGRYKERLTILDKRSTYSVDNAVPGKVSIDEENKNMLVWTPDTPLKNGKEYTVFVSKDIKGKTKVELGYNYSFGFTVTPEHYHGNLDVIKETLEAFDIVMSDSFIQSLMVKHSQYACDIWYETNSYDEDLHKDGDAPYYINEYVNTQVLIDAFIKGGTAAASMGGDENFTLGDFSISKGGSGGGSESVSISDIIDQLNSQLKQWEDLIHGHHNRGYAKPGNTVKGESISVYPEYLTRSVLNDFDS